MKTNQNRDPLWRRLLMSVGMSISKVGDEIFWKGFQGSYDEQNPCEEALESMRRYEAMDDLKHVCAKLLCFIEKHADVNPLRLEGVKQALRNAGVDYAEYATDDTSWLTGPPPTPEEQYRRILDAADQTGQYPESLLIALAPDGMDPESAKAALSGRPCVLPASADLAAQPHGLPSGSAECSCSNGLEASCRCNGECAPDVVGQHQKAVESVSRIPAAIPSEKDEATFRSPGCDCETANPAPAPAATQAELGRKKHITPGKFYEFPDPEFIVIYPPRAKSQVPQ